MCGDRAPTVATHAPNIRLMVAGGTGAGQSILLRRVASVIGSGRLCKVRLKHPDVDSVHAYLLRQPEFPLAQACMVKHVELLSEWVSGDDRNAYWEADKTTPVSEL